MIEYSFRTVRRYLIYTFITSLLAFLPTDVAAQDFGLKTNLLYWGTTTPNIGAEFGIGSKETFQVVVGVNPWKQSGGNRSSIRHWIVMPEWRRWLCQPYNGWFWGVHAFAGSYKIGQTTMPLGFFPALKNHRYEGSFIGGGVTVGYQWILSRHWNFEASIGIGAAHSKYDKHCISCDEVRIIKDNHFTYLGPTKAALSLVYVFNGKDKRKPRMIGRYTPQLVSFATTHVSEPVKTVASVGNKMIRVTGAKVVQKGGDMTVRLAVNLDSLRLGDDNQLVYTPIVHSPDSDYRMPAIIINGRHEQKLYRRGVFRKKYSPDVLAVGRVNGTPQTISYVASVPVRGSYDDYALRLEEDVCGCGNPENDSIYTLLEHHRVQLPFVRPRVEAEKIRSLDKHADISFPVGRSEMRVDFGGNAEELDSIISTISTIKADRNLEVLNITVHGYASPDGRYSTNERLALSRTQSLTSLIRRMLNLPKSVFTVQSTAEDWDGLRQYIDSSDLDHKAEILAIAADSTLDPDTREKQIRTLYPDEYHYMLDTWYPLLRHTDYRITYKVRAFNADEAKALIKTRPQLLSLEEMFRVAQTYETGSREFNEVMEIAARIYPHSTTANLNAAVAHINAGDFAGAHEFLDKAGDSDDARHAREACERAEKENQ